MLMEKMVLQNGVDIKVDSLEDHIDEVSNEIKIDRHKDTVEYRW
jgi:hypothetical protein